MSKTNSKQEDIFFNVNDKDNFKMEELYQRGLPRRYRSIHEFCINNRIVYQSFLYFLEKYPDCSIASIYQIYLKAFDPKHLKVKNIMYGISLDAICVKYQLNSRSVLSKLNEGSSLLEALDFGLLSTPIIPFEVRKKLQIMASQIKNIQTKSQMDALRKFYCLDSLTYQYVLFYTKRYNEMKEALKVYEIVHLFESGWEEYYGQDIKRLHESSNHFWEDYKKLQLRAQKELLLKMQLSYQDLQKYYQEYYDSYQKIVQGDIECWSYSPKKANLSKKS